MAWRVRRNAAPPLPATNASIKGGKLLFPAKISLPLGDFFTFFEWKPLSFPFLLLKRGSGRRGGEAGRKMRMEKWANYFAQRQVARLPSLGLRLNIFLGRRGESPIHCSYSQLINFVSDRFITRRTLLLREQSIFLSLSLPLQYLDTIWFDRPIDCYEIALVPVLWSCIGEFRSLIEEKFHFFLLSHSIFLKKKKK